MPKKRLPPRLWAKPAERGRPAVWIIKDGKRRISTGCGIDDPEGASRALARYLAAEHARRSATLRNRSIDAVPVADVVLAYWSSRKDSVALPEELQSRLGRLVESIGDVFIADLSPAITQKYVRKRKTNSGARRELEDLRAAIKYAAEHRLISAEVPITLPEKPMSRERWLTREEAARLLWAAWRYREIQ